MIGMKAQILTATLFTAFSGALSAADPQLLNLVMPDAKVLAGVNVEQAKGTQFGQYVLNQLQTQDAHMQELVALIQNTVAPYANTGMAVRSFDSKLIVTADEAGHQEVANVLMMLRDRGEGAGEGQKTPRAGGGSIGQ